MALRDPVAVYNAASNAEAQLLRNLLSDAGIEAFAVEDISQVGTWALGLIPEIHKPQVWVDRDKVEEARSFLEEFESRSGERGTEEPDDEFCYECGEPVEQGVTPCPACGKVLDWSQESRGSGRRETLASEAEGDPENVSGSLETLQVFKKPLAWFYLSPFLILIGLLAVGVLMALLRVLD